MTMPARAILDALTELGRTGVPGIPAVLGDRHFAWHALLIGNDPWERAAKGLQTPDLVALMRGLVLFCHASELCFGSPSPVIVLYREYLSRCPPDEPEVTAWIVDHRRNNYEPFGTSRHYGARTVAEFHRYRGDQAALQAQRRKEGLARDAERKRRDALAKAARATKRIPAAVRRGDIAHLRSQLRRGGDLSAALPPSESLIELARSNQQPAMVSFLESIGYVAQRTDPDEPLGEP